MNITVIFKDGNTQIIDPLVHIKQNADGIIWVYNGDCENKYNPEDIAAIIITPLEVGNND